MTESAPPIGGHYGGGVIRETEFGAGAASNYTAHQWELRAAFLNAEITDAENEITRIRGRIDFLRGRLLIASIRARETDGQDA